MLSANIRRGLTRLLLAQHADDLLLAEPRTLHPSTSCSGGLYSNLDGVQGLTSATIKVWTGSCVWFHFHKDALEGVVGLLDLGEEGLHKLNRLVIVAGLLLCGCTDANSGLFGEQIDPSRVDESADSPGAIALQGGLSSKGIALPEAATFVGYYKASATKPADASLASAFLQSGITLSDRMCSVWFVRLGRAQARADNVTSDLASLGSLTSTLLGFGRVNPRIIGGIASAFLFGHQVLSSDQTAFIVAPDIGAVQSAIVTKQKTLAAQLVSDAQSGKMNFWTAERNLINYDDQCSHLAVKNFVTSSVKAAAEAKTSPAASDPTTDDTTALAEAAAAVSGFFLNAGSGLSTTQVASIFALTNTSLSAQAANNLLAPLVLNRLFTSDAKPVLKPGLTVAGLKGVLSQMDGSGALSRASTKLSAS